MITQDSKFLLFLFSLFIIVTAIQLFYFIYFYLKLYLYKPGGKGSGQNAVSIIICARNEAENLKKFLPAVLEQDYPNYEVIVVNDCSEDNSYIVLGEYIKQYPNLKISTINKDPKFTHNKKFAQFIGIKAAKNEILLFTDADCQPESEKWLAYMASNFNENTGFVLGYGGYLKEKSLLNKYIRYDTMTIAMQYLGMAIRGFPYMGVGRNLAYRRSLFFSNKGFGAHNQLISGDDDLFVNSNAVGSNTCVEFRKESHTRSVPCMRIPEWITQKKRHLTTAPYYKLKDKLLLFLEPASRIIFYSSFMTLVLTLTLLPFVITLFGIRLIIQIVIFSLVQKRLNEPGVLAYSLIFDIFSPLINGAIYISNFHNKPGKKRWK
jgi:cellulose synthase/poly-beta-1,6-N-acetylglucosamine synthase-like glycosyltransferase